MINTEKIKVIFIDIDDTLLDFNKCADEAMCLAAKDFGVNFPVDYFPTFTRINNHLWHEIEKGSIVIEELYDIRWNLIFSEMNIDADGKAFEKSFRSYLDNSAVPIDGAKELLEYLKPKYRLFAASNAPAGQQQRRLKKAGMLDCFEGLFVSEEMGASKPSKEFFDRCFASLGDVTPEETVMIGDSLTADISGACQYGIASILFNHRKKQYGDLCTPYVVEKAEDIKGLL